MSKEIEIHEVKEISNDFIQYKLASSKGPEAAKTTVFATVDKNGVRNGQVQAFANDKAGKPYMSHQGEYKNGVPEGVWIEMDADGYKKEVVYSHHHDVQRKNVFPPNMVKSFTEYDKEGNLFEQARYNSAGLLQFSKKKSAGYGGQLAMITQEFDADMPVGEYKEEFSDGSVLKSKYENGVRSKNFVMRDKAGVVLRQESYKKDPKGNDVPHGSWKTLSNNGRSEEGEFANGKKEGTWTIDDGSMLDKTNYLDGKKEGKWERSFRGAKGEVQVAETGAFKNDKEHGLFTRSDAHGSSQTNYENGKRNGPHSMVNHDLGIKEEGSYKDDLKDGLWSQTDNKGVTTPSVYKNGNYDQELSQKAINKLKSLEWQDNALGMIGIKVRSQEQRYEDQMKLVSKKLGV